MRSSVFAARPPGVRRRTTEGVRYSNMTLSQLSAPGEGTRGKLGTDGVQSVTSCWGETNSRFLPLGRIGFAPEYWRHFGLELCGMRAPRRRVRV